jgi:hypothetical protein
MIAGKSGRIWITPTLKKEGLGWPVPLHLAARNDFIMKEQRPTRSARARNPFMTSHSGLSFARLSGI